MFFVISEHICSETSSYDVCVDSAFVSYADAVLYCNYKNHWNEQGDGSNVHVYFIQSDFTVDPNTGVYILPYAFNSRPESHGEFDKYILIYDIKGETWGESKHTINVSRNAVTTSVSLFINVKLISVDEASDFTDMINDKIHNNTLNLVYVRDLIKYILINHKTLDNLCSVLHEFYARARMPELIGMRHLRLPCVNCDGDHILDALFANIYPLQELLKGKVLSLDDMTKRNGNHGGHRIASTIEHYEMIVNYLTGETDEYGQSKIFDHIPAVYELPDDRQFEPDKGGYFIQTDHGKVTCNL